MTIYQKPLESVLREIIAGFQAANLEPGVPREVTLPTLPRKAAVCIGVRRCGKSTLLEQTALRLEKGGVAREGMVHVNFFDDRLDGIREAGFDAILDAFYGLRPERQGKPATFFFDEIQQAPKWEKFVDRLLREGNNSVYLTGSSAAMLSREIATEMRGRSLTWELFPFSFREFLAFRAVAPDDHSPQGRRRILKVFEEYWTRGGFPEVRDLAGDLRVRIHQEYVRAVLFRDIVERHNTPNPQAVVALGLRLLSGAGSLYSINRLCEHLKTRHLGMSKEMVWNCASWFEDAFFLFSVPLHDASEHRRAINPRKVYGVDHALIRSLSSGILRDEGHLLENLVFLHLRRATGRIFYHRTKSGKETDFLAIGPDGRRLLVQVCALLSDEATRTRELSALHESMRETGEKKALLVTFNEEFVIREEGRRIDCVPAWRFLLSGPF